MQFLIYVLGITQGYELLFSKDLTQCLDEFQFEQIQGNLLFVFNFTSQIVPLLSNSTINLNFAIGNLSNKIFRQENVYVDQDSIQTNSQSHFIEVASCKKIYLKLISNGPINGTLQVYRKEISNCVNECNGKILSFQTESIKPHSRCQERCHCDDEHFGRYCQLGLQKIEIGEKVSLSLRQQSWFYVSIKLLKEVQLLGFNIKDPIDLGFSLKDGDQLPQRTSTALKSRISLNGLAEKYKARLDDEIIVGFYSVRDQNIEILFEPLENLKLFKGNSIFIIFTLLNLFIMFGCYMLTQICRSKGHSVRQRVARIRPRVEAKPRQYSGVFVNKHFEQMDYHDAIQLNKKLSDYADCVICMEKLSEKDVTITPCMHIYHHHCLKKWLMKQIHCPTCRFEFDYETITKKEWLKDVTISEECQRSTLELQSA